MHWDIVEQLVLHIVGNNAKSFTKLKMIKYRKMRDLYSQLPSYYVYTACHDASARGKSFFRMLQLFGTSFS